METKTQLFQDKLLDTTLWHNYMSHTTTKQYGKAVSQRKQNQLNLDFFNMWGVCFQNPCLSITEVNPSGWLQPFVMPGAWTNKYSASVCRRAYDTINTYNDVLLVNKNFIQENTNGNIMIHRPHYHYGFTLHVPVLFGCIHSMDRYTCKAGHFQFLCIYYT